jgi:choline dehydrogenase-like flavoprotein
LGESELAMAQDMREVTRSILEAAGGVVISIDSGGSVDYSHYVGTCRMGTDAEHSVLNPFVGPTTSRTSLSSTVAAFLPYPEKNPTESVIAVSLRAADDLAEELRAGSI